VPCLLRVVGHVCYLYLTCHSGMACLLLSGMACLVRPAPVACILRQRQWQGRALAPRETVHFETLHSDCVMLHISLGQLPLHFVLVFVMLHIVGQHVIRLSNLPWHVIFVLVPVVLHLVFVVLCLVCIVLHLVGRQVARLASPEAQLLHLHLHL